MPERIVTADTDVIRQAFIDLIMEGDGCGVEFQTVNGPECVRLAIHIAATDCPSCKRLATLVMRTLDFYERHDGEARCIVCDGKASAQRIAQGAGRIVVLLPCGWEKMEAHRSGTFLVCEACVGASTDGGVAAVVAHLEKVGYLDTSRLGRLNAANFHGQGGRA